MEPTNTSLAIIDQPTKDLLAQIQTAHEMCERRGQDFVRSGTEYALYVLRTGCFLRDLKDACPKGRFEALASAYLPGISESSRLRYMKAYANAATQALALERGDAPAPSATSDEDDTIEAEVVEAGSIDRSDDPRALPLPELLRSPQFDRFFANKRVAQSLFAKVKGIIGDRSITKLYRESGAIPDLKRGQGKARGPYAKTQARRTVSHLGKAQQITALVSALDKEGASAEVWQLLASDLAAIFEPHGFTLSPLPQASE